MFASRAQWGGKSRGLRPVSLYTVRAGQTKSKKSIKSGTEGRKQANGANNQAPEIRYPCVLCSMFAVGGVIGLADAGLGSFGPIPIRHFPSAASGLSRRAVLLISAQPLPLIKGEQDKANRRALLRRGRGAQRSSGDRQSACRVPDTFSDLSPAYTLLLDLLV